MGYKLLVGKCDSNSNISAQNISSHLFVCFFRSWQSSPTTGCGAGSGPSTTEAPCAPWRRRTTRTATRAGPTPPRASARSATSCAARSAPARPPGTSPPAPARPRRARTSLCARAPAWCRGPGCTWKVGSTLICLLHQVTGIVIEGNGNLRVAFVFFLLVQSIELRVKWTCRDFCQYCLIFMFR